MCDDRALPGMQFQSRGVYSRQHGWEACIQAIDVSGQAGAPAGGVLAATCNTLGATCPAWHGWLPQDYTVTSLLLHLASA